MKFQKEITALSILIILLSVAASATGVFSSMDSSRHEFTSIHGRTVEIYGVGLYRNDSVSMASQAIAQDVVTLLVGVPLLATSLILLKKRLLKGQILLAGTLAYFLYTYASYSFTSMYNNLFLIDVGLMSLSFFSFLLTMMAFDMKVLQNSFSRQLPVKTIAGYLLFIGTAIGLMWLGKVLPSLTDGAPPAGLDHYTTLVIQALDLGFVVPVSILSAILLLKRKPFGLLISSVICVKGLTMLTALTAMIIGQIIAGVQMTAIEIILFPAFNLIGIVIVMALLKHIKEPEEII